MHQLDYTLDEKPTISITNFTANQADFDVNAPINHTPSLPKCSAYKFFQKSKDIKFDQVCRKK
jgi:hypothetical protein